MSEPQGRGPAWLLGTVTVLDAAWLGLACGALVATGLGSDAGLENLGQVLSFLERAQPAVASRIKAGSRPDQDQGQQ